MDAIDNLGYINDLWLGNLSLPTISLIVSDLCEAALDCRALALDGEETVTDEVTFFAQIATAVDYCESTYGEEATVEALAEAGADPEVIAEAQAMKAKA